MCAVAYTEIVAYTAANGSISFLVCKYRNDRLYKAYIDTDVTALNAENDLIIGTSSDIVALRCGIDTGKGRQTIYDFTAGDYDAVSYNSFENANVTDMDAALQAYASSATAYISFSEASANYAVIS